MLFDKLSLFADGKAISVSSSNSTTLTFYSKVLDLRKCGQIGIDGGLKLYGQIVGTVNAGGTITTVVQTSADGVAWTDLASQAQDGNLLLGMFLPFGLKRFIRLKFVTVSAASAGTEYSVKVKAGLVDEFDVGDPLALQEFPSPGKSGGAVQDLAADALFTALKLAAASGTITKGSSGTVGITAGKVTTIEAPAKYTVTVSGSTITIALAADASTGTVYFVDGLGNKVAYAVTAQNAG